MFDRVLPGKAPLRGAYTHRLRSAAGAPEALHPGRRRGETEEETRARGRIWEEDGWLSTGGEVGEQWIHRAGGEQTAQIITPSSGMEREKQGGEINSGKERE